MARLITDVIDGYHSVLEKGDPRVDGWLGMSSPIPTILCTLTYILVVTRVGPSLMKNRKAFELNNVLIVYNAAQVVLSTWLFYEAGMAGWFTFYSYKCQPIDYSNNPLALRMVHACWWYYMSKFTEFLDTIFFVLRKKNNQITTLHVIHHSIMPVSVWIGVKYFAGGQGTLFGLINTFVHIVMYAYYLLAALGPAVQPYLWWKRYITQMQLVQFGIVVAHALMTVVIECPIPKALMYYIIGHGIMFIVLFSNFYVQSYLNKRAKAKKIPVHTSTTPAAFTNGTKKHSEGTKRSSSEGVRQRGVS